MRKEITPDVIAQMAWLRNRRPEIWNRATQKIDSTVKSSSVDFASLPQQQLEETLRKNAKVLKEYAEQNGKG